VRKFFRYSNLYLYLAIIVAMALTGCARVDTLPQLEIVVLDETGKPVAGAYVGLFDSAEEWKKLANPVQTWRQTGIDGRVVFVDLRESDYYFYVRSADKDNSIRGGSNHRAAQDEPEKYCGGCDKIDLLNNAEKT
jgi:hypothetical protein